MIARLADSFNDTLLRVIVISSVLAMISNPISVRSDVCRRIRRTTPSVHCAPACGRVATSAPIGKSLAAFIGAINRNPVNETSLTSHWPPAAAYCASR